MNGMDTIIDFLVDWFYFFRRRIDGMLSEEAW